MQQNQLESLKRFTTVVADSGDIESIRNYSPKDATTNPSLILKAANLSFYKPLLDDALLYAKKKGGSKDIQLINASDKLSVSIGIEILKIIPGYISTEIDARLSFNVNMCVERALKLINLYQEQGIEKNRILIKLATTWEGIQAAKILSRENINCNMTLLFSFAQAKACAESKVYLISPFVGRIYDWYDQKKLLKIPYKTHEDPGVQAIHKIFNYYKYYNYKTIIMGASFRNTEQVLALAGCDKLTISPEILEKLCKNFDKVEQKLFISLKSSHKVIPTLLSEQEFRWEHNQDAMAVEKLSEGIRKFAIDQKKIEDLLEKNL